MKVNLLSYPTTAPDNFSKKEGKELLKTNSKAIAERQNLLMADGSKSLLVVIQGMDASGKDSAVKAVFKRISPSGIQVKSFKKPTDEEFAHDFLWRVHQHVPAKGMIQVFNRSHYEDVLIQRVHKWISEDVVAKRFNHINNFEQLLVETGTEVVKFFLHTDKAKQLIELNERKTDPTKHWKHNSNDYKERKHWNKYMKAYESVFENCSKSAPWHIIPSDENWYKEYLMSTIVKAKLEEMDLAYPPLKK
ncbi:MAG: PPK2 family polyphosphate kinase [Cyclobacteriaceae bacterium]